MCEVMVSVVMITYNHEEYIQQALESVISQKTNFSYEVIIGDDRSPDNTREILQSFAKKYPEKIRLVLREENIGVINNLYDIFNRCKGKYIAFLEGDDYWTDTDKLQKQVDFLESNKDYIGVAHRHTMLYGNYNNNPLVLHKTKFSDKRFTFQDFTRHRFQFHMNSLLFRNDIDFSDHTYKALFLSSELSADYTLFLILLDISDIFIMKDIMSVYRFIQKKGKTNYYSIVKENSDRLINDTIKRHETLIPYFETRHDLSYIKAFLLLTIAKDSIQNNRKHDFWRKYFSSSLKVKLVFIGFLIRNITKSFLLKINLFISVIRHGLGRKNVGGN